MQPKGKDVPWIKLDVIYDSSFVVHQTKLNSQAVSYCSLNLVPLLQAAFQFHVSQLLTWKCCRCLPIQIKEGEEIGTRVVRRCYNHHCACFKSKIIDPVTGNRVHCYNCDCGPACILTPELIQKKVVQEDKKKNVPEGSSKKDKKMKNVLIIESDDDAKPTKELYVFYLLLLCVGVFFFFFFLWTLCL
jgi:hypothetical protein